MGHGAHIAKPAAENDIGQRALANEFEKAWQILRRMLSSHVEGEILAEFKDLPVEEKSSSASRANFKPSRARYLDNGCSIRRMTGSWEMSGLCEGSGSSLVKATVNITQAMISITAPARKVRESFAILVADMN